MRRVSRPRFDDALPGIDTPIRELEIDLEQIPCTGDEGVSRAEQSGRGPLRRLACQGWRGVCLAGIERYVETGRAVEMVCCKSRPSKELPHQVRSIGQRRGGDHLHSLKGDDLFPGPAWRGEESIVKFLWRLSCADDLYSCAGWAGTLRRVIRVT